MKTTAKSTPVITNSIFHYHILRLNCHCSCETIRAPQAAHSLITPSSSYFTPHHGRGNHSMEQSQSYCKHNAWNVLATIQAVGCQVIRIQSLLEVLCFTPSKWTSNAVISINIISRPKNLLARTLSLVVAIHIGLPRSDLSLFSFWIENKQHPCVCVCTMCATLKFACNWAFHQSQKHILS